MEHEYKWNCNCDGCMYKRKQAIEAEDKTALEEHRRKVNEINGKPPLYNIGDCDNCPLYKLKQAQDRLTEKVTPNHTTVLVCFESGHYKKITGKWKGDASWTHWIKPDGKTIHIYKDKVEYYEEL